MLLLKCCNVSWLAFVDPTCPEHPSGRFAKFIPSTVWSLLVEYLPWVEEVVEAATWRPFPATSQGLWYIDGWAAGWKRVRRFAWVL